VVIAAGVVVVALIIGGVVYATAGTSPASGTAAAAASRSPPAPASPVPSSTPPAALTLNDLLASQSTALLAGNETAWLALVKPSDKNTFAVYRRLYDGLRALQVKRLSQVVADDAGYDTHGSKVEPRGDSRREPEDNFTGQSCPNPLTIAQRNSTPFRYL
jgi:hypothetical protein